MLKNRKRVWALLLAVGMLAARLPAAAAEPPSGGTPDSGQGNAQPHSGCEAPCTGSLMNPDCPVCGAPAAAPEDCALRMNEKTVKAADPVAGVNAITEITGVTLEGTPRVGETLTAKVSPDGALAVYKWFRSDSKDGGFTTILGLVGGTYRLEEADKNTYLKVKAIGGGEYGGEAESGAMGPVAPAVLPLTGVTLEGTPRVGETLTAKVSPAGATATAAYEWLRSESKDGGFTTIPGVTGGTYRVGEADKNTYVKVKAIGGGEYGGEAESAVIGPVTPAVLPLTGVTLEGTPRVGETLTAKVSPDGATATAAYEWLRSESKDGGFTTIPGVTGRTYRVGEADKNTYVKVKAIGGGEYGGEAESAAIGPVSPAPLPLEGVTLNKTSLSLAPGEQELLTASVVPEGAAGVSVKWASKDPGVAAVSGAGQVTAVSPGETEITVTAATAAHSFTAACRVRVTAPAPNYPTSSGGGSGGSDGSDRPAGETPSSQAADPPSANVDASGGVKPGDVASEAEKSVAEAIRSGQAPRADVTVQNAASVSPQALREMDEAAKKAGGAAQLLADTIVNGKIAARLYIDAAKAVTLQNDILLGVSTAEKDTGAVVDHFAQYFANDIRAVSFAQKGPFGIEVGVAVRVDLSGLDIESLVFYSYDSATNRYREVKSAYYVDQGGFLHLTVDTGGYLFITDRALTRK